MHNQQFLSTNSMQKNKLTSNSLKQITSVNTHNSLKLPINYFSFSKTKIHCKKSNYISTHTELTKLSFYFILNCQHVQSNTGSSYFQMHVWNLKSGDHSNVARMSFG